MDQNEGYIYTDINEQFYSDSTGQPFRKCIECEKELIESNESYFVEKAIRRYPNSDKSLTIFEFAICHTCASVRQQQMSAESAQAIQTYFMNKQRYRFLNPDVLQKDNGSSMITTCIFSNEDIGQCEEFQIVGEFNGKQMKIGQLPIAISGKEIEAISEILSEETKGGFDDFIGTHFSGPPELAELWEKPRVVLV